MQRSFKWVALAIALGMPNSPTAASTNSAVTVLPSGLQIKTGAGTISVEPWSDTIIHVRFAGSRSWSNPYNSWVIAKPLRVRWSHAETRDGWLLRTSALTVTVGKRDGAISFSDAKGHVLLSESSGGRSLPKSGSGPVAQAFATQTPLYGLGQHQNGLLDYRGSSIHLQQENRDVAVPMMASPLGFGLLWNNASVTDVDVMRPGAPAPLVIRSEAGAGIDYDFIYGPSLDRVIAGYRHLTGDAPMMPRWMWGLWQSRERYQTQAELLDVARRYREIGAPIDVVVQDWQYWRPGQWGSHQFDPARYPDPAGMVADLHKLDIHAAISVWARFDLGTDNLAELDKAGAVFPKVYPNVYPKGEGRWYDPFSPAGRALYWAQIERNLGRLGFDAWWLDASEAELGGKWGEMRDVITAAGPGRDLFNAYPLMHTTAVYQGALRDHPGKRPVILTRSAFAGQQRNGAITWSGDTQGDWKTFRLQIPAALNFSLSGLPYWSADIGGFFGGDPQDKGYSELFTRWYQFAVFNPMFRVHGTSFGKEPWAFAPETTRILIDYDKLRYRLLPYIYATSWQVTSARSTMMRALAFDFPDDKTALGRTDEYMFGNAFLVAPVLAAGATTRIVYLPGHDSWFDFRTGARAAGGQEISARADLATMPLMVRAGSIVPLGPVVPHAGAPSREPIELRVYPGRDGSFTLYDDAGDGFGYKRGERTLIPLRWSDRTRSLRIAARQGGYTGMAKTISFKIVCGAAPAGGSRLITYDGASRIVPLPDCR